jgi:GntR family transcriptional regulator
VQGSAYQFLGERCGIALSHGEQTIEAVLSSEAEAEVFGFTEPQPPAC